MTDLQELTQYVEENPNDHEKRWLLAKKLYNACEYRLALEHLQVLRNEWREKLHVVRYSAATYYRLGRYEEALRDLEYGVATWPNEIGLREQEARVLETAGRREEAARAWDEVLKLDPKHSVAESAVKRLHEKPAKTPTFDLNLVGTDSGINLHPGQTCPNCGAQNTLEAELCWQCKAPIFSVRASRAGMRAQTPGQPLVDPQTLRLAAGIGVGVLLLAAFALGFRSLVMTPDESGDALMSFYQYELAGSRLATGIVLVLVWPLVLHLALYLLNNMTVSFGAINLTGLFLAGLTFLGSCISAAALIPVLVLAAVLSLFLFLGLLRWKVGQALMVWGLQLVIVPVVAVFSFAAAEYIRAGAPFNPVTELPAVIAYARYDDAGLGLECQRTLTERLPADHMITWSRSGSVWLDHYGSTATITIVPQSGAGGLVFDFLDDKGSTMGFDTDISRTYTKTYRIEPGKRYRVKISGPEAAVAEVSIRGLLRHRLD
ncbi:MAG: tetratricopeptide repeat protein [Candidatus Hydrogenedentes bacterium]|nr:tetratricopeptide repeat protein [Candidatus Hydrogenedentota bacterium]